MGGRVASLEDASCVLRRWNANFKIAIITSLGKFLTCAERAEGLIVKHAEGIAGKLYPSRYQNWEQNSV